MFSLLLGNNFGLPRILIYSETRIEYQVIFSHSSGLGYYVDINIVLSYTRQKKNGQGQMCVLDAK